MKIIEGSVTPHTNPNTLIKEKAAFADATSVSGSEARIAGSTVENDMPSEALMISKIAQVTLGVPWSRSVKRQARTNIVACIGRYAPNLLREIPPAMAKIKIPIVIGMKLTSD